jgi:hypothetical protein
VFSRAGIDVCDTDPGHPVRAWLDTDPVTLTKVWMGELTWASALSAERLRMRGDATACRAVPGWLGLSRFASVQLAPTTLPR